MGVASSADAPVLREVRGAVGLLTLNRPKALNALNSQLSCYVLVTEYKRVRHSLMVLQTHMTFFGFSAIRSLRSS